MPAGEPSPATTDPAAVLGSEAAALPATGLMPLGRGLLRELRLWFESLNPAWIGLGFVFVALTVYVLSNGERRNTYNHFVWQAEAFLDGRFLITWPVDEGPVTNAHFNDIFRPPDRPRLALLPFAPLPAVLLLPFVLVFGVATNAAMLAAVLGAINVGLAWRLTIRLTSNRWVALLATAFYGFGTVAWYAAMLGSTWFLAHVVASTFLILAITAALDGERASARRATTTQDQGPTQGGLRALVGLPSAGDLRRGIDWRALIDGRQLLAGLLLGFAALAREEVLIAAPFFVFVGGGGTLARRAFSAGIGASLMLGVLFAYNLASSGAILNPVYEHLYHTEYVPRPELRHTEWNRIDPRYMPQNFRIMLTWPPEFRPECGLDLFNRDCALLRPDPLGMSVLLTSPAYLLAVPLVWRAWRRRIVLGATLAVLGTAGLLMMHFSQGWVQFGYRFSNSFAPFALVLVTLALARLGIRPLTVGLVIASIAINAWGVWWGIQLGW